MHICIARVTSSGVNIVFIKKEMKKIYVIIIVFTQTRFFLSQRFFFINPLGRKEKKTNRCKLA